MQIHHRAHGVVVSHPLSMREALGSIPSVSIMALPWCMVPAELSNRLNAIIPTHCQVILIMKIIIMIILMLRILITTNVNNY